MICWLLALNFSWCWNNLPFILFYWSISVEHATISWISNRSHNRMHSQINIYKLQVNHEAKKLFNSFQYSIFLPVKNEIKNKHSTHFLFNYLKIRYILNLLRFQSTFFFQTFITLLILWMGKSNTKSFFLIMKDISYSLHDVCLNNILESHIHYKLYRNENFN